MSVLALLEYCVTSDGFFTLTADNGDKEPLFLLCCLITSLINLQTDFHLKGWT